MNQEREIRRLQTEAVDHYACDGDYSLGALSPDKLTVDAANTSAVIADVPGNDYARMRLQRMTDYYAGSPPYGFDSQSYGPGYKYPVVEHVYESPDSLRREDAPPGVPVPHYMPRLHEQYGPTAGQTEGSRPIAEGSPQVAHLVQGASYRAASGAPSKTKNAGNYSL